MIAAARKHGTFPGMAGVYNATIMPRYIDLGARFILSGQDAAFWPPARPNEPAFCGNSRPPSGGYCRSLYRIGPADYHEFLAVQAIDLDPGRGCQAPRRIDALRIRFPPPASQLQT
jgi:hypothetical protein